MSQPLAAGVLAAGTNWPEIAAWAAWATVGVYLVLGGFAWRQVHEARKLREEQARPFVIVDFEPGFLVYLTVENLGRTMARDITIEFDQPLESTLRGPREIDESPLFREPIPTLPPGKKIRVLFDQFNNRLEAGLPLTYNVKLRYHGPRRRKPWEDRYRLDLSMYIGAGLPPKGIPELVAEVESIRKEIETWRLSGGRGLLVHNLDQRRKDRIAGRRTKVRIFRKSGAKAFVRWQWDRALSQFGLR